MTLQVRDEEEKGLLEGSRVIKHDGKYYLLMILGPMVVNAVNYVIGLIRLPDHTKRRSFCAIILPVSPMWDRERLWTMPRGIGMV